MKYHRKAEIKFHNKPAQNILTLLHAASEASLDLRSVAALPEGLGSCREKESDSTKEIPFIQLHGSCNHNWNALKASKGARVQLCVCVCVCLRRDLEELGLT